MNKPLVGRVIKNRYVITGALSEGTTGVLYRATDTAYPEERSVAIKQLKQRASLLDMEKMLRFKQRIFSPDGFIHPAIVRIIEIVQADDDIFIVMEYLPGKSLQDILDSRTGPVTKEECVHIGMQAAQALEYIHAADILHQDIKPANIMILDGPGVGAQGVSQKFTPLTDHAVKLVDFGIADIIKLSIGQDSGGGIDLFSGPGIEGRNGFFTFSYMSPEKVREHGPGPDERSDLYSLGVMLYQLSTGSLPFVGDDIHSIIYQHIAKIPQPPIEKNHALPHALSNIILKLLEKEPESRYQSARGLINDLERLHSGDENFEVGRHDRPGRLRYRSGFVGREHELEHLQELYRQAMAGTGSLVIISGEEGVGKTFLLDRFRKNIHDTANCCIGVRCRSDERAIAYGIIRNAFEAYIEFFNGHTEAERKKFLRSLREAAGGLGGVLVAINPRMGELIGETRPLPPIEKDREQRRFLSTAADFLCTCAAIEKGMIILLEDLHRADETSLLLLLELSHIIAGFPLLIVGTCRDTDINYGHGMKTIFIEARSNNRIIQMPLARFDVDQVAHAIAGFLHRDAADAMVRRLSGIIAEKSSGNPLCVKGLLNYLFDEQIIFFDNLNSLQISADRLSASTLPETIVDIFLKRVSYCTDIEKEILTRAAVIGYRFAPKFLTECCHDLLGQDYITDADITAVLIKGIDLRLLETIPDMGEMLGFSHDTVRELFYNKLYPVERTVMHRRIAEALKKRVGGAPEAADNSLLYEIAYHAIEAGEREDDLPVLVQAGMAAMRSHAYDNAVKFFSRSTVLLEARQDKNDDLAAIKRAMADIFVIIGRYDEAIAAYQLLIPSVSVRFERAYLYKQIAHAYFKKGDFENNERFAAIGLSMLDERLPVGSAAVLWSILAESLAQWIPVLPRLWSGKHSTVSSERYSLIIWFYYALSWAYVINNTLKFFRTILRMFNLARRRLGDSRELALSHAYLGVICFTTHRYERSMHHLNQSLAIRNRLGDEWGIGQTYQFIGFCYYFFGDFAHSGRYFSRSREIFKEVGDIKEYGMTLLGIVMCNMVIAEYPAAQQAIEEFQSIAMLTDDKLNIGYSLMFQGQLYFETGVFDKAVEYLERADAIGRDYGVWVISCVANVQLCRLYTETGESDKALEKINRSREIKREKKLIDDTVNFLYLHQVDAQLAWCANTQWTDQSKKASYLKQVKRTCRRAARTNRKSIIHIGYSYRLLAKCLHYDGEYQQAEKLYCASIEYYQKYPIKRELAMSRFAYGLFLGELGRMDEYRSLIEDSYAGFIEIGDAGSIARIEGLLGIGNRLSRQTMPSLVHRLKHEKKISGIMELSRLGVLNIPPENIIDKALDLGMQIVGAERGCIIKKESGSFAVVAMKNINNLNREYLSKTIVSRTLNSGLPQITTNAEEDSELSDVASVSYHNLKSIMSVPVLFKGEIAGAFYCDNSFTQMLFSEQDVEIIADLLAQISSILAEWVPSKPLGELIFLDPSDLFCKRYEITPREREVLGLIVKGYTRKGIASRLSISWVTVHNHIYNIYNKTGANSKTTLIELLEGNVQDDAIAAFDDATPASLLPEPTDEFYRHYEITLREREVLGLLLKGYTRKGIAEKLSISRTTAHTHIYNIYNKTGAKSKTDLITLIHEH